MLIFGKFCVHTKWTTPKIKFIHTFLSTLDLATSKDFMKTLSLLAYILRLIKNPVKHLRRRKYFAAKSR